MKLSLRNKYFIWLLLLMLSVYVAMIAMMSVMEMRESNIHGTPFEEEIPEIIALVVMIITTLPVVVMIAWYISGRLLRPLQSLLDTADRIRQGDLSERIPIPEDHQLALLAGALNEAFDRYGAAVRRLESFSADASHQLRTPMAAIRVAAEVTLQQPRSAEEYEESLSDILEQTDRLNHTVDQLLLLARMDQSIKRHFKPVMLSRALTSWVEEASSMFENRELAWHTDPACEGWHIAANQVLLRQCFDNLINNSVACTGEGGRIAIRLMRKGDQVEWSVEDDGPGIPEAERAMVFERFFKGKKSTEKGSGLGLAIVKEIIAFHGGSVRASSSRELGGAAIIMAFHLRSPEE